MGRNAGGVLELYWFPPDGFAPSMQEHIESFGEHSAFPVVRWNTALWFPDALRGRAFDCVLLHYSLFGGPIHWLDRVWLDYLDAMPDALKVAMFQDEYRFWGIRYALLEDLGVHIAYTCFEPAQHAATYFKRGWRGKAIHCLTGYVGDRTLAMARKHARPDARRGVDVGYRARRLEEYMGRGAMEKHVVGEEFARRAAGRGLVLDIAMDEASRIYGEDWYAFLGNCRGVLGVEAGVSVVDTEDALWPLWRLMKNERPDLDFETFRRAADLDRREDAIPLRTLSPRHFEAAALGTCQILFEGRYSGVLEPWRHYLPLKKDFSNVEEILDLFADPEARRTVADTARREVVDSGRHSYQGFVAGFDAELRAAGLRPGAPDPDLAARLEAEARLRLARVRAGEPWFGPDRFPRPNWPANLEHLRGLRSSDLGAAS